MIYLYEAIADVKKYYPNIPDDMFMKLISLDPEYRGGDSLGKNGKWILNLYKSGNLSEEDFDAVTDVLRLFKTYRNRLSKKDLTRDYKSLEDLESAIAAVVDDDSMLTPRQIVRFLKNVKSGKTHISAEDDYDVVLDTPKYTVYVPNTHEASMKLGKGTEWCTAHENHDWYDKYTQDGGKLYIVASKSSDERWQYSDKTGDFLDKNDAKFDVPELLKTDRKLSKFFSKLLGVDIFDFDGSYVYTGEGVPYFIAKMVTSITIPDSVTSIGASAFENCTRLTSITIPKSVTSIGHSAFSYCSGLTDIKIPDSVTSISNFAFYYCTGLTNVTIGNSVTKISTSAFSCCRNMTSIVIPDSVTIVDTRAFFNCTSLTNITIPNSVTSIGNHAFRGCMNLVVSTNSDYVIAYCRENSIPFEKSNKQTENIRLNIRDLR